MPPLADESSDASPASSSCGSARLTSSAPSSPPLCAWRRRDGRVVSSSSPESGTAAAAAVERAELARDAAPAALPSPSALFASADARFDSPGTRRLSVGAHLPSPTAAPRCSPARADGRARADCCPCPSRDATRARGLLGAMEGSTASGDTEMEARELPSASVSRGGEGGRPVMNVCGAPEPRLAPRAEAAAGAASVPDRSMLTRCSGGAPCPAARKRAQRAVRSAGSSTLQRTSTHPQARRTRSASARLAMAGSTARR